MTATLTRPPRPTTTRRAQPPTAELYETEALAALHRLPPNSIDMLLTDPPYSSGGIFRSDRNQTTREKYTQTTSRSGNLLPLFTGDNRDQRSWITWSTLWLSAARVALKPKAYALVFTDWRQLPALSDAIQAAGFIWRGLIAWNKGEAARAPHKGYFRHQCEYIIWATNGPCPIATHDGPYPGCIDCPRPPHKQHSCEKPQGLIQQLLRPVPVGGTILDPFAGSAAIGSAAKDRGMHSINFECDPAYAAIARRRLAG